MKFVRSPIFSAFLVIAAIAFFVTWLSELGVSEEEVYSVLEGFDWRFMPLLLVLLTAHVALSSWRWSLFEFSLSGERPRFRGAMVAGLFALGLGALLPAPIVNMACRGLSNRIRGTSAIRGAVSGGIDQISDFLTVTLVAGPALFAFWTSNIVAYAIGAPAALLAGGILLFFAPTMLHTIKIFPRAVALASPLLKDRKLLLHAYGISIVRVINLNLITLMIHFATGAATVSAVLISVPLATLAIALSMLPGGIGASEWSFSTVFAGLGVGTDAIVLFVLANRIVLTSLSIILLFVAIVFASISLMGNSSGGNSGDKSKL